jgi:excisionase family DNA binding protein
MLDNTRLYSTGEAAECLGIPRWRIGYLIEAGKIPEASHNAGGRRLFTAEDLRGIAKYLIAEHAQAAKLPQWVQDLEPVVAGE